MDLVVDGGFIANFPIFIFDSVYYHQGNKVRIYNPYTLGIRIDSQEQIVSDKNNQGLVEIEIDNIKDYVEAFYVFTLENLNRCMLTKEDWDRTISVSSVGIGPKVKKLTETEKDALIRSGIHSVNEFFEKKQNID